MDYRENLDLKSIEDINAQVRALIPVVICSLLGPKDRASVTLALGFQLCEDSDTHIKMTAKLTPRMAAHSKAILLRMANTP